MAPSSSLTPRGKVKAADRLSQLPLELAFLVLTRLSYRGLTAMARVSHYWRELTFQQGGVLWYKLCRHHGFILFPLVQEQQPPIPAHNIHMDNVLHSRPGLGRALIQSQHRLSTNDGSNLSNDNSPQPAPVVPHASARLARGKFENWREYFETSMLLEREWIAGRPQIRELRGHENAVLCIKSLKRSNRIVSGDQLGHIRVWCSLTGRCLRILKKHLMGVSCLSVQGEFLLSGSWDSTVIVWRQLQSPPYLKPVKIMDLGEQVMAMDLDKDMNLAIGAVSGVVKIISIGTYSVLRTFHPGNIPNLCTAVALNQKTIEATVGAVYYTWDRHTGEPITCMTDSSVKDFSCMKIDKSKRVIFTGSQDAKVRIYSWGTKPILLRQYGGHSGGIRCLTLQDNMLLTGSGDKTVRIVFRERYAPSSVETAPESGSYREEGVVDGSPAPVSLIHPSNVNAIDSDCSMLVTGSDDGVIRIFDFGSDLWRPPSPSSPRLCGQASLVSAASPSCVLMKRPGGSKASVGNRRQTWGESALAVLTRARELQEEEDEESTDVSTSPTSPSSAGGVWMDVDEIYDKMIEWDMRPVSQGSSPKHTLNLALHMMAQSDPPTILLDSTLFPHRFGLQ
ncbi:hypothetical protein BGZ83_009515 [Gryganskiella cystojenkinii]|nr:hypothetical protein BGZ83_009515 [Gryganskiella cystojenkinii]